MSRTIITRERNSEGEIVYQHEATTAVVRLAKYQGPWEGMMQFSGEGMEELHERLADRSLGMQAVRVLVAMLNSVQLHDGNRVRAGRKDLAKVLGMTESNVSGSIRRLVDCGFIEAPKRKFDAYVVSPRFAWYGKREDLCDALRQRGMLDRNGMMRSKAA